MALIVWLRPPLSPLEIPQAKLLQFGEAFLAFYSCNLCSKSRHDPGGLWMSCGPNALPVGAILTPSVLRGNAGLLPRNTGPGWLLSIELHSLRIWQMRYYVYTRFLI